LRGCGVRGLSTAVSVGWPLPASRAVTGRDGHARDGGPGRVTVDADPRLASANAECEGCVLKWFSPGERIRKSRRIGL
jgi:hypothetical protein